jgi:hypothetical protein
MHLLVHRHPERSEGSPREAHRTKSEHGPAGRALFQGHSTSGSAGTRFARGCFASLNMTVVGGLMTGVSGWTPGWKDSSFVGMTTRGRTTHPGHLPWRSDPPGQTGWAGSATGKKRRAGRFARVGSLPGHGCFPPGNRTARAGVIQDGRDSNPPVGGKPPARLSRFPAGTQAPPAPHWRHGSGSARTGPVAPIPGPPADEIRMPSPPVGLRNKTDT